MTDTVGFVQRLPTTLVAAFRATLEEVKEADLLIHVVDASHPSVHRQMAAVEEVLKEIEAADRPMIIALNKLDLLPSDMPLQLQGMSAGAPTVAVSAKDGTGIDELLKCVSDTLVQQFTALDVLIPYTRGDLVAQFHQFGTIEHEGFEEGGTHIRGHMPQNHSGAFIAFQQTHVKRVRA